MITSVEDLRDALAPLTSPATPVGWDEHPSQYVDPVDQAPTASAEHEALDPQEATSRVMAALGPAPVAVDEISRATGLPMRSVRVALLELALDGRIEQHGGQLVSLR